MKPMTMIRTKANKCKMEENPNDFFIPMRAGIDLSCCDLSKSISCKA